MRLFALLLFATLISLYQPVSLYGADPSVCNLSDLAEFEKGIEKILDRAALPKSERPFVIPKSMVDQDVSLSTRNQVVSGKYIGEGTLVVGEGANAKGVSAYKIAVRDPDGKDRVVVVAKTEVIGIERRANEIIGDAYGTRAAKFESTSRGAVVRNPETGSARISGNAEGSVEGKLGEIKFAAYTDKGFEYKKVNEDAVFIGKTKEGNFVAASIDGIGGSAGGDIASNRLARQLEVDLAAGKGVRESMGNFSSALATDPKRVNGMGAAIVTAEVSENSMRFRWAGDAKGVLLDGERIAYETVDDANIAEYLKLKKMTQAEAMKARDPIFLNGRNVITNSFGYKEGRVVPTIIHESESLAFRPGQRAVLASDGLWDNLTIDEVRDIVANSRTEREAMTRLKEAADTMMRKYRKDPLAKKDNINVVVIFR